MTFTTVYYSTEVSAAPWVESGLTRLRLYRRSDADVGEAGGISAFLSPEEVRTLIDALEPYAAPKSTPPIDVAEVLDAALLSGWVVCYGNDDSRRSLDYPGTMPWSEAQACAAQARVESPSLGYHVRLASEVPL